MLSEEQIKEILVQQREAIIKKDFGIEREVLKEFDTKIKLPHVIVLTGLRRSGKSTLLKQLIHKYYNEKDFYYINFEDERFFNFPAEDFNNLYEVLISLYGEKHTFFLDEIQNVPYFERFIRRFYDQGFKFFVTGSNATLLSKELSSRLTGRHLDIVVRPFSFKEFLSLRNIKLENESIYKIESKVNLKNLCDEYIIKGGMPEYLIYDDPEILTRVYEDIVIKDIAVRYKVDNVTVLRELYSFLISNYANKFSFNSVKKLINISSVHTIKKFLGYLEETYLAESICKFDYSLKKRMINNKKLYLLDNGFIQVISKRFTKDKGWLLENLVLTNLRKSGEVFYYSGKFECDFILAKDKKVTDAIQVCYFLTEQNKDRELEGLKEAMNNFDLKEGLLLTNNQEEQIIEGENRIVVKPIWKWLLEE